MTRDDDPSPPRPPFRPSHDRLLRRVVGFGVVFALFFGIAAWVDWRESRIVQIAWTPEQPVPFSHKHHVADLGLDCRYCHTGVEKSSFAGLPSASTCMTCHSQIWKDAPILSLVRESAATGRPIVWQRVTELPDFVHFNHAAHIGRGVACASCHGDVSAMPQVYMHEKMEMQWCLACHRNPEARLVPPSKETDPHAPAFSGKGPIRLLAPAQKARLTNCSTCHR